MASRKKPDKEPEHLAQKPFASMLAEFTNRDSSLDNPMSTTKMSPAMMRDITISGKPSRKREDPKRPKAAEDVEEEFDTDLKSLNYNTVKKEMDSLAGEADDYMPDFDHLIEGVFEDNDDVTLKNSLISMGRKYAVKGLEEDSQTSEVTKAFSTHEQQFYGLIDEFSSATMDVSKEIEAMRAVRSRDRRALSDMMEVRASLLNGKLSAIDKLVGVTKSKFDISIKLRKEKQGLGAEDEAVGTQTIQKLFSIGRKNLIAGTELSVSEPLDESPSLDNDDTSYMGETAMHKAMEAPDSVTDGDKFIEHEDDGVEYVLDVGADGDQRQIYAIDKDDNIIPDYPMPTNPDELHFVINDMTGEATDQLQRTYRVRKDGVDMVQRESDD